MSQRVLATAALLVTLAGCDTVGGPKPVKVTKVVVNGIDNLYVGATKHFTVTVTYDGDAPSVSPAIEWSSSSVANASVDADGNVTGVAPFIDAIDGLKPISITARVMGVVGTMGVKVVAVPGFVLFPDSAAMLVGTSRAIRAYDDRNFYNHHEVVPQSWSSDRPDVATVTGTGTVTAVSPGKAIITAHYESNGGSYTLQSTVIVVAPLNMSFTAASGGPFVEDLMSSGVYARYDRNCGLASDGAIYCWALVVPGIMPYDECDVVFTQGHYVHTQCSGIPARLPVNGTFAAISMGAAGGGCGLTSAGEVYCFGLNYSGQLGVAPSTETVGGHTTSNEVNVHWFTDHGATRLPSTEPFRAVFAGSDLRCAIQTNNIGVCWGGGLGEKPVQMSTFGWNTFAERGSCGIIADSSAVCFTVSDNRPALYSVPLPYHLTHIDVSDGATCGLASTGEIACWQPGGSPTTIPNTPKVVSLGNMPSSVTFHSKTCGLTSAGDIYCIVVGGTTAASRTYSLEPLDLGVKLKSFSGNCGIGRDSKVYCWRWNSSKAVLVPGQ